MWYLAVSNKLEKLHLGSPTLLYSTLPSHLDNVMLTYLY